MATTVLPEIKIDAVNHDYQTQFTAATESGNIIKAAEILVRSTYKMADLLLAREQRSVVKFDEGKLLNPLIYAEKLRSLKSDPDIKMPVVLDMIEDAMQAYGDLLIATARDTPTTELDAIRNAEMTVSAFRLGQAYSQMFLVASGHADDFGNAKFVQFEQAQRPANMRKIRAERNAPVVLALRTAILSCSDLDGFTRKDADAIAGDVRNKLELLYGGSDNEISKQLTRESNWPSGRTIDRHARAMLKERRESAGHT